MKSSFEDKVVPENITDSVNGNGKINGKYTTIGTCDNSKLKASTYYTVIIKNLGEEDLNVYTNDSAGNFIYKEISIPKNIITTAKAKTKDSLDLSKRTWLSLNVNETVPQNLEIYLVEGDYTNYDFSDYDPTKAGKYKAEYKVTGKNKFNGKYNDFSETNTITKNGITFTKNKDNSITINGTNSTSSATFIYVWNMQIPEICEGTYTFSLDC